MQNENGEDVTETMTFKNLGDFDAKNMLERSEFMNKLNVEKEQNTKIARQLSSNKALLKALENPDKRQAIIDLLEASLEEIKGSETK